MRRQVFARWDHTQCGRVLLLHHRCFLFFKKKKKLASQLENCAEQVDFVIKILWSRHSDDCCCVAHYDDSPSYLCNTNICYDVVFTLFINALRHCRVAQHVLGCLWFIEWMDLLHGCHTWSKQTVQNEEMLLSLGQLADALLADLSICPFFRPPDAAGGRRALQTQDANSVQPHQRPGWRKAAMDGAEQRVCRPDQTPRRWVKPCGS